MFIEWVSVRFVCCAAHVPLYLWLLTGFAWVGFRPSSRGKLKACPINASAILADGARAKYTSTVTETAYVDKAPVVVGASEPNLANGRPKGVVPKQTAEAKAFSRKFTDDLRWEKMIWFWIDNPEMMPAGVFTTLMYYRFGKPPQTVQVKGEILARPYLGQDQAELAAAARAIADRMDAVSAAKLVESVADSEK